MSDLQPPAQKIALFGGTFDPVHLGHVHLAQLAKDALSLDQVRFIPCKISPHKTGTLPASPADRLKMLELATAALPWASVDDIELSSPGPNYSYLTAEAFHRRFPGERLFWIMGGDQWTALPNWKHPEKLAEIVEFIVIPRGGDAPLPREGYRMHLVPGDHPASSTLIRSGSPDHLHPDVAAYIAAHRIYSSQVEG